MSMKRFCDVHSGKPAKRFVIAILEDSSGNGDIDRISDLLRSMNTSFGFSDKFVQSSDLCEKDYNKLKNSIVKITSPKTSSSSTNDDIHEQKDDSHKGDLTIESVDTSDL